MVGYVLPLEAAVIADYMTFPGFPGRFMPGEPLSLAHLGLDEETADDIISALALPLEKVEMGEAEAMRELDRGDNFAPSSAGGVVVVEEEPPRRGRRRAAQPEAEPESEG